MKRARQSQGNAQKKALDSEAKAEFASGCRTTREALLEAAKETFAKLGFHGATFSAIADRAGVNGSQINYHFHDKIQLYRAILEKSGDGQRLEHLIRHLKPVTSQTEFLLRLELFAEELLCWHAADELAIRVVMLEMLRGLPLGKDLIEERVNRLWQALYVFIESARQGGFINEQADSRLVAASIMGVFNSLGCAREFTQSFIGTSLNSEAERTQLARKMIKTLFIGLQNAPVGGLNDERA
jgi:AcrR family transcriptional regulator